MAILLREIFADLGQGQKHDESADDDDEAGYRFGAHAFRNGEYVSIRDEDGEMHAFQVVSVEPAT